jgi:hypothetical protein
MNDQAEMKTQPLAAKYKAAYVAQAALYMEQSTPGPTYCFRCGTANQPGASYCSGCGAALNY